MTFPRKLPPILAILGVLAIGELSLRHWYFQSVVTLDPVLDELVAGPGRIRWHREGDGTSHWIEHGVRRHTPPAQDRPRVLVLGDSYTEALQVDDGETFADVAEARLRAIGSDTQLINEGSSTRSVAHYIALAPRFAELFSPTWTVVQLRDSDVMADAWHPAKTHFERTAGEGLRVVRVAPSARHGFSRILWDWRQRSALVGYAVVRLGELREVASHEPPLFRAAETPRVTWEITSTPEDYPVEAELAALVDAFDARVTLLYLASFDPTAPLTPTPTETRVSAYAASRGIGFVNTRTLHSELRGWSPFGFSNTPYNQGHLNSLGHRLAGDLLAVELRQRGLDGLH